MSAHGHTVICRWEVFKTQDVLPKYYLFATEVELTHFATNPIEQHRPIALSGKMEIFYMCAVQYGSHWPKVAMKYLRCGSVIEKLNFKEPRVAAILNNMWVHSLGWVQHPWLDILWSSTLFPTSQGHAKFLSLLR